MLNRHALVVLALIFAAMAALCRYAKAETIQLERVVPPGASLTYSVNGSAVSTIAVPEGRVHVTITYGGPVGLRHRRCTNCSGDTPRGRLE